MSDTLYVGVIRHAYDSESPASGYNYDEVREATKGAYIASIQEVLDCTEEEAECASLAEYSYEVIATTLPAPPTPPEPKWFTEAKDLYSPSDMANDMIESFDMSTLYEVLKENLNSPEAYINILQDGHIGQFCELETHLAGAHAYDDEFLQELSKYSGRPVEQYKTDDKLVVLDYLRKEAKR